MKHKLATDAVQPIVAAANIGSSTDGFESVSNQTLEGSGGDVSPLVGLGNKIAKPFLKVGSKVAAPFAELGSTFSSPFEGLFDEIARAKAKVKEVSLGIKTQFKRKILEPKLAFFAPLAKAASELVSAPGEIIPSGLQGNQAVPEVDVDPMERANAVLSGNVPRPVDVEEELEEVEEIVEAIEGEAVNQDQLQSGVDSLQPPTVASQNLSDDFQPIVDSVNVEEPVNSNVGSENVAGISEPVAQVTAPVIGSESEEAVELGAEAVAPVDEVVMTVSEENSDTEIVAILPLREVLNRWLLIDFRYRSFLISVARCGIFIKKIGQGIFRQKLV